MSDELIGKQIRVCHKKGYITDKHLNGYIVEIEIGGVHQKISVTQGYVVRNVSND